MAQKDTGAAPKVTELVLPNSSISEPGSVICGIVMPISAIDGCTQEHWQEVLNILKDVIDELKYVPNLVSDAEESGIIQRRIIQNLYDNKIVVCDVSGKNPNVMFELGIRLAFDKPTIIIKDDCTDYSFDTGVIEHLCYPRDLTYWKILSFKKALKEKITKTLDKARNDPEYSTFLKNFGEFKVAKLGTKTVSKDEYILESLKELKAQVARMGQIRMDQSLFGELVGQGNVSSLINAGIKRFLAQQDNLSVNGLYNNPDMIEKLVDYLEENKRLTKICDNRSELRAFAIRQLILIAENEVNSFL